MDGVLSMTPTQQQDRRRPRNFQTTMPRPAPDAFEGKEKEKDRRR
jgi:hypothetical protein